MKSIVIISHDPTSHLGGLEAAIAVMRQTEAHLRALCVRLDHSKPKDEKVVDYNEDEN